ncbi:GSCOCG00009954001-RA-CDS [Cotesia congregata]|uniref:Similar to GIT2: ARF GTPase-activating protein GIT2 (Homo sapiens) n=1 Tax=Cotesia congregata TaxID=51543 RepID=A0A8J2HAM3_COTCN|nr:GSCOCG00009954001-RA-CDS [Cotesia congregata]CAG5090982.1 Similar to GIT2: ARF GTPase-activating protein GIT2 (Homo sapiens) [Cotesia congregata]
MSRPKYKTSTSSICADCGALEPGWASINRAILLCDECCSIHRSLGRHVSHVKSLHKGFWSSYLLTMVHTLNDNGANNIWEYSLHDSNNSKVNRKKPQPKDPLYPVKADFIRAKHQQLTFVLRPSKDESCSEEELSKQLHSSVRTSNLETSLRLLVQGGNPNYFYKEKGTTPLHVAARAGQALQLELLIANGGNPNIVDSTGHTPAEIARITGHLDLSDRLIECMYQVTDRLTYFICSRKPDHRTTEHLIIPEWSETLERNELTNEARNRLQMLPNNLLEELTMDVYDEVDRREVEAVWLSSTTLHERSTAVPFLPVNPYLSSTRNQGRQKLARFMPQEFATLIVDILTETARRHMQANCTPLQDPTVSALKKERAIKNCGSQTSDDEPLYDSVASDDELGGNDTNQELPNNNNEKAVGTTGKSHPAVIQVLKKQLNVSESTIKNLHDEIQNFQQTIQQLTLENRQLKNIIDIYVKPKLPQSYETVNGHTDVEQESVLDSIDTKSQLRGNQRPVSMYETRQGLKKIGLLNVSKREDELPEVETRSNIDQKIWECQKINLPARDQVTICTDQVTKGIQELWMAMQDPTHKEDFVPCAEKIRLAVTELTTIFSQSSLDENIRTALRQLNGNTGRLQTECVSLERCTGDSEHTKRCLQQVRCCAYDIAKATKLLVTHFQSL